MVVDEKVLVLAERLKKKDASKNLYKPTTENIIFFNKDRKFIIKKQLKVYNSPLIYYYWIADENSEKFIDKRFVREERFAINNHFT